MREIKFRAKRRADGVWVEGYLCEDANGYVCIQQVIRKIDYIFPASASMFVINPLTIGQYTGLKDKNGKEIYEGDIVKTVNWETPILAVVIFSEGLFRIKDPSFSSSFEIDRYRLEIIGNIYDNPELLEGTK